MTSRLGRLGRRLGRILLPRTITAQFAWLLVVALVAANVIALLVIDEERTRVAREVRRGAQIERLAGLASVLEQVPPDLRRGIAETSSTPFLRLSVDETAAVETPGDDAFTRGLARHLDSELADAGVSVNALVSARVRWPEHRRREERRAERHAARHGDHMLHGARPSRAERDDDDHSVRREHGPDGPQRPRRGSEDRPEILYSTASIPFADGMWLNATMPGPGRRPPPVEGRAVLLTLGVSLIFVLAVAITFLRRLTRPIRSLAAAAERAGYGDRSAVAAVGGPAEVRRAAEAFNAMQTRIAHFDAERARTIAAVGHDLRTPITSLRIRAEMLEDEEREAMIRTLDEMRVIADGLLSYGRSEAEPEARRIVDLADLLAGLAGDGITYAGPESLPMEGRPVALSRAFANLAENARRYAGGGRFRLCRRGGRIIVMLDDDGPGIPEDRLADMFEPFVRLEGSRSTETGGAGLGLSIARTLIRAHGGDIALVNREEGGLRVRVTFQEVPTRDGRPRGS